MSPFATRANTYASFARHIATMVVAMCRWVPAGVCARRGRLRSSEVDAIRFTAEGFRLDRHSPFPWQTPFAGPHSGSQNERCHLHPRSSSRQREGY